MERMLNIVKNETLILQLQQAHITWWRQYVAQKQAEFKCLIDRSFAERYKDIR